MKAFRGTLVALLVLLAMLGAWYYTRPPEQAVPVAKKDKKKEEGRALFQFEKANLVKVEVKRPEGQIVLAERDDGWWIEGENLRASRSMVNRVKHQLHDLVARATVVEDVGQDALYGLGAQAIRVTLSFRDGSTLSFDAGDPNPSGVSFYIRPVGTDSVFTVKKSAVDYYSLSLAEFRERRFATFDAKDVDQLDATLPEGKRLKFQRNGETSWDMLEPETFAANDSEIRSLLGRVSAMKAIQFVGENLQDLSPYGLDQPRATISIRYSNGDAPMTLLLGKPTGEKDGEYPLAYAKLADEPHVYAVRDGLLEDYGQPPAHFRLTRFARMDENTVQEISATFDTTGRDADLNGTVKVTMAADQWLWDDGVPVPGSTPRRLAGRACGVESEEFVADAAEDAKYGFDRPLVKIYVRDSAGAYRNLMVGKPAPAGKRMVPPPPGQPGNPAEESYDRYYARVAEFPEVYVIDASLIEVVKDLMREHRRKADEDAEKAGRREKINQELGSSGGQ